MRLSSMFFALLLAPLALPAQTSSMIYSPTRPAQGCPVSVAAHRVAGNSFVQTDTPASTEEEKQMRTRILDLRQQIDALKAQEADLRAKFAQTPDAAIPADLQRQLKEIDAQLAEKQIEATQLGAKLALEQARRSTDGVYSPAPGLDLRISPAGSRPIVAVDILVHGFSNRGRLMPASQVPNAADSPSRVSVGPSDRDRNRSGSGSVGIEPTESFHLSRDDSGSAIRASIATKGMTGIAWLEVTSVEFADGSTWLPAGHDECRFAPSLYVPVALGQ